MDDLGFKLEQRGADWVILPHSGGGWLASTAECKLWEALEAEKRKVAELEGVLDVFTCKEAQELREIDRKARVERDEWNRFSVQVAGLLGVPVGAFKSEDVGEQYAELREQILAKIQAN